MSIVACWKQLRSDPPTPPQDTLGTHKYVILSTAWELQGHSIPSLSGSTHLLRCPFIPKCSHSRRAVLGQTEGEEEEERSRKGRGQEGVGGPRQSTIDLDNGMMTKSFVEISTLDITRKRALCLLIFIFLPLLPSSLSVLH